jgi:hypothetical protein
MVIPSNVIDTRPKPPKNTNEIKTPFATIALIIAWASLTIGFLAFVGAWRGGSEELAVLSLASGIITFGLFGILYEISCHLEEIRAQGSKNKN